MAGRPKKRSARQSATPSQMSHSSADSFAQDSSLAGSILSPHSATRLEEKDKLIHLNDRLANYINRVRSLEKENRHLDVKIKEIEVVEGREKQNMRAAYEKEIGELRRLLDDLAKQKAELQIAHDRYKQENMQLKNRVAELERRIKELERLLESEQSMLHGLQSRNSKIEGENSRLIVEMKALKSERDAAVKAEVMARKQLEEETVLRVDTENRLQSAKEQLEFTRNMHAQTIAEMREKRETEIALTSRDIEDDFNSRLQEELNSMRMQLDAQLEAQRRHLESKYNDKLNNSAASGKSQQEEMRRVRDEMLTFRGQMETVSRERSALSAQIESLKRDLERAREAAAQARADFDERMRHRDDELSRLHDEIGRMLSENQDLMDIKIKLDAEINAYRALLEDEESRLHISSGEMRSSAELRTSGSMRSSGELRSGETRVSKSTRSAGALTSSPGSDVIRGMKRRRVDVGGDMDAAQWDRATRRAKVTEFTNMTGITVSDHDASTGRYVKITNDTAEELNLGGYKLKQTADGGTTQYKFVARHKLPANGGSVTVWSSSAEDGVHSPPHDLQMKSYTWPTGNKVHTALLDKDDEEVAWRLTDGSSAYDVVSSSEFTDAKGERCSIM